FHHAVPDLPQPGVEVAGEHAGHRDVARRGVEHRGDHLRRPDHLLPDRRAARPCAPVAGDQGEAAPVAISALGGVYSAFRYSDQALRRRTDMNRTISATAAAAAAAFGFAISGT